jgi:N-acetylmuramoyl-L-alanine amidase
MRASAAWWLCGLAVLVLAAEASAAVPVRTMYTDALAREQAVRVQLVGSSPAVSVLADVRAVIAKYESVVRRYPASSYCDNALWQAARLAIDAFAKFNQPSESEAAARLLRRLVDGYPSSRLVAEVPDQLARLGASPPRRELVAASRGAEQTASQPTSTATRVTSGTVATTRPASAGAELARPTAKSKSLATIKDIRRTLMPEAIRVVIELDGEVPFRDERIADPWRVFVDLPGTRPAAQLIDQTLRFEGDADLVRQVRIGRHPNNTTRIVLDADGISSYSVYPLYDPYRLVIDCVRATGVLVAEPAPIVAAPLPATITRREPTAAKPSPPAPPASSPAPALPRRETAPSVRQAPPPLSARPPTAVWLRSAPSNTPQHGVLIAEAHGAGSDAPVAASTVDLPAHAPTLPEALAAPPVRNSTGRFSIARQLGLGVSRIVIDAGHGGHDPGAQGRGVVEAELVLDVALRLEKLLQKVPGVEVILTRRTDEFVQLQERTAIANREGADLFLSIHANASPSAQARGVETYFLNFASNLSAAAVAARENAASGQAMGALPDIVKAIALNNKLDESRDFATQVQHAMTERLRAANKTLKDLGVKQAPFVVLIGAAMPSVLAEISFVTNPQEAKLLKGGTYRQRIADALFDAIRKYQTSLRGVTTMASPQ